MAERVSVEVEQGVAHVQLTRADKHNALDGAMFNAIIDTGKELAGRKDVRAVVLSGQGPSFCAGLDFQSFMSMGKGKDTANPQTLLERPDGEIANRAQLTGYVWKQVPVPVIAAIHGVCYGGGLQIALGADIRLAHPEARLSVMEIKWGLIPDMSGTQTLRQLVRLDVAKELTFTGRIVEAPEAQALGLVTRTTDKPTEDALEMARLIASKSPHAIRAGKRLLESNWHDDAEPGLALEAELQTSLMGSPNQLEAVMANMQKRAPNFQDP